MAFGRTKIIVPALAVLAGVYGAYKLWSAFYKQSSNKKQTIDGQLQDVAEEAIENIAEEAKEENLKSLSLKDECPFGSSSTSTSSAGSPVDPPLFYMSANSSPSSSAGSAPPPTLFQYITCEEKEENINATISERSSSAASSVIIPARFSIFSDGEPTSAPLTLTESQDNSNSSIAETSGYTITYLSSSGTTLSEELTNELKMEIENMKNQLPIYSETFIGLQMRRELGGGTFGRVYEADTRLQKVAVKVLIAEELATLTESAYYTSLHEFYAEALLLSNLNHPNILSFEFIISDVPPYGLPGMATEFMPNDLYKFIRRPGFRCWNDVWSIAVQVANGLKYLHSRKIVHFDIKSSNILLDYSGNPAPNNLIWKVADFGLPLKNSSGPIRLYSQRGTTHYMAPEIIRTSHHGMQSVTEKVDVYSFGILLWELIMGKLPYSGMTDDQIDSLVQNGHRPNVPNCCDLGWSSLMKSCWSQDEDQRPSFDQIVVRLSRLLGAP